MKVEGVEYSIAKLKLMSVLYFLFSYHIVISRPPTEGFLPHRSAVSRNVNIFRIIFSSLVQIYQILPAIDFEIKMAMINIVIITEVSPTCTT